MKAKILFVALIMTMLTSCVAEKPTEVNRIEPTSTQSPPTDTPEPTNTPEPMNTPGPTALPGEEIYPLDSLASGIPWLPYDEAKVPMIIFFGLNVHKPPFDVPEVRRAFFAALDTEVLTSIYEKEDFLNNETSTRSVIPSETLSRDVYGDIGISYDPALAKQLLAEAGYEDRSSFPEITFLVIYIQVLDYPEISVQAAEEAIRMWEQNLGVTVNLEVIGVDNIAKDGKELFQSGEYDISEQVVWADENDPNDFIYDLFHPDGEDNLIGFDSGRVTKLIQDGKEEADPAKRLPIYLEIDRILSEEEVPILPILDCTVDFSQ
jgi:ABC-type oligopeptide transport system substrate-binding subunit